MFVALRKIIVDEIRGTKISFDVHFCQPISLGDGYVEYVCMEVKDKKDVAQMLSIYVKFGRIATSIKLHAIFGKSLEEILALMHKPRFIEKILAIMCESIAINSNYDETPHFFHIYVKVLVSCLLSVFFFLYIYVEVLSHYL